MSPSHSRYLVQETAISMVINVVLSALFCGLLFGGRTEIPFVGLKGYGVDFLPQTFMITLMSVIVPGLLTRKRRKAGQISGLDVISRWPAPLALRAPIMAVTATLVLGGGAFLVGWIALAPVIGFGQLLPIKLVYGALAALIVTPLGLREALGEPNA